MDAPSLLGLPTEILQQIVTDPCLSLQDVCRISLTCGRLHRIISNSWSLIANSRYNLLLNEKKTFFLTPDGAGGRVVLRILMMSGTHCVDKDICVSQNLTTFSR